VGVKETLHPKKHKTYKRSGTPTKADKVLVAQFVANNAGDVSPVQERALAKVMRRSNELTKQLIDEAREKFLIRAGRYVDIHMETTEKALAIGSDKSLEVAARASQWALEHISEDGARIVERDKTESDGSKIMIGVQIAGMISGK
jgi:hypothetical protein